MWIEDLTKALWMLNGKNIQYMCCVLKIEDNIIYMTNGTKYLVYDLVAEYDQEYHS